MTFRSLADQIADFTIRMEEDEDPPDYKDALMMLMRAMVEIRHLERELKKWNK